MMAFIVGLGIMMVLMVYIGIVISSNNKLDFDGGVFFGIVFSIMFVIEVSMLSKVIKKPTPTAMDVYQGKTTLEYTIRDEVKIDSIVVFKNKNYDKK